MAANALDIARRELLAEADTQQAAGERASLQALLDSSETELDALQRTLCQRIADGALDVVQPDAVSVGGMTGLRSRRLGVNRWSQ